MINKPANSLAPRLLQVAGVASPQKRSVAPAEAVKHPELIRNFNASVIDPVGSDPQTYGQAIARENEAMARAASPWLAGAQPGVLDAYALTLTRWGTIAGIGPEVHPELWTFVEQVAAVPAVARVIERERLQLNMAKPA